MFSTGLLTLAQAPVSQAGPLVVYQGWFVGWGTLALINAGLAQGKGRSGLVWFLISLLGGPLATLLIAIFPRVPIKPA
jgi:hypothetical protein